MTTTHPPVCPRCGTSLENDAPEGLCPRCLAAIHFESGSLFTETGASLPPPPIEEIAPHFPQLEILSCLGRGGMGVVYKARQISLDRLVALKLLAPEREKDPEFSERFAREAQALAKMSHPHIVTVHDFGQAGGFFYLLMEYVDGANLRQLLQSHKFTPEQALAVVPPLCDALQYAHDRGIVHRDIKPENLLMDRDGKLKVADFGLVKMLGSDAADERAVGTPSYMAPEQAGDPVNVDNRADIYSLGVVIYELLTGELPARNFQPPSGKSASDPRLDDVVRRALEQEPGRRYQQASILKTEVERISQSPPVVPPVPQAPVAENVVLPQVPEEVRLPAIAMMVASGLAICNQVFGAVVVLFLTVVPINSMRGFPITFLAPFDRWRPPGPPAFLILLIGGWVLVSLGLNIAALVGANRMRKLQSYRWSVGSAVVLIAVGVLSLPGIFSLSFTSLIIFAQLGAGIWALVVLMREEVKSMFVNRLPAAKPEIPQAPHSAGNVKRKLMVPATGLMVTGALNLLAVALFFLVLVVSFLTRGNHMMVAWAPLILAPLIAIPSILMIIGGWKMRSAEGYVLAFVASVLALITPPGLLIGVVFGIWALVVLCDREVKAAFPGGSGASANKGCLIAALIVAALFLLPLVAIIGLRTSAPRYVNAPAQFSPGPIGVPVYPDAAPIFPPAPPATPGSSDDLAARLEASRSISDFMVRDKALAKIAADAGASANAAITKQALAGISDFMVRDGARRSAALQLSDHGLRKDAVEIARQISDFIMRDQTLTELSTRTAPTPEAMPEE